MVRHVQAAGFAVVLILSLAAVPAVAGQSVYDFSDDANGGVVTPATIGLATFSSPSDPGAFAFGPNADLFSDLGPFVLSSQGNVAELDITFAVPQDSLSFDYALGDFFASQTSGPDTITVTPNSGAAEVFTAGVVGSDFFPEGSLTLSNDGDFTSVAITSAYPIIIADMTSVPEPASMTLLGAGLLGLVAARRKR